MTEIDGTSGRPVSSASAESTMRLRSTKLSSAGPISTSWPNQAASASVAGTGAATSGTGATMTTLFPAPTSAVTMFSSPR